MLALHGHDDKIVYLASRIPLDQMKEYCHRQTRRFFSPQELELIARVESDPSLLEYLRTMERERCRPEEIPLLPEFQVFTKDVRVSLEKAIAFRLVLGRYTYNLYKHVRMLPLAEKTRH